VNYDAAFDLGVGPWGGSCSAMRCAVSGPVGVGGDGGADAVDQVGQFVGSGIRNEIGLNPALESTLARLSTAMPT
jgi:hypothetical protein